MFLTWQQFRDLISPTLGENATRALMKATLDTYIVGKSLCVLETDAMIYVERMQQAVCQGKAWEVYDAKGNCLLRIKKVSKEEKASKVLKTPAKPNTKPSQYKGTNA